MNIKQLQSNKDFSIQHGSGYDTLRKELKSYIVAIAARCDGVPETPTLDDLMEALRSIRLKVQYAEKVGRDWKKGRIA